MSYLRAEYKPAAAPCYPLWRAGHQLTRWACSLRRRLTTGLTAQKNVLIIVSGGPAPGVPNAVRMAAITAMRNGCRVYGSLAGIEGVKNDQIRELTYRDVYGLKRAKSDDCLLRSCRTNPTVEPAQLERIVVNLRAREIDGIVLIGGNGTLAMGKVLSENGFPVFLPAKSIDNDFLPAEEDCHTIGLHTAATANAHEIENLVAESNQYGERPKWFFVRVQGRTSGELAYLSATWGGAQAWFVPEDFNPATFSFAELIDRIEVVMKERQKAGHNHGVIVLSEGLEKLVLAQMKLRGERVAEDSSGNLIADLEVEERMSAAFAGVFSGTNIHTWRLDGNRTTNPTREDIRVSGQTGRGAARLLIQGKRSAVLAVNGDGQLVQIPFTDPRLFDEQGKASRRGLIRINEEE